MDKLQPIIRHHFWILFLVALILPPIAWSMTSGALDEQTQARVDELDKTLSGVASGAGAANADWTNAANQLVNVRKESNRRAWNRLWDVQETLQLWPDGVREFMASCPYRGTPADTGLSPEEAARLMGRVPDFYREDYEREIERVWRLPEPLDEQSGMKAAEDAPQKVLFPSTVMPRVPRAKWMAAQPTWPEMWNAQEDLWLMSELLKAIARTNADATSIADSNVRQIRRIQLFGGARAAAGSSASAGSSGGGSSPMSGLGGPGGPGPGYGRVPASAGVPSSADFSLSEEYDVKDAPAGSGFGMGSMGSMGSMASESSGSPAASAGSDPQADENRYIRQEWAYRTRGFKLQLTVHQMYVPMLVSELLKSKFPLEVVRLQQSALNPDRPGSNRTGAFGGLAAAGSGYPGGSNFPGGGGYPGGGGGYPGGSSEEASGGADSYPGAEGNYGGSSGAEGESGGFDPLSGVAGPTNGAAAANNAVNSAVVAAALSDVNLMDVVIVGEIYLYNQPEPAETPEGAESAGDPSAVTGAPASPADVDPTAALPPTDPTTGAVTPAVDRPGAIATPTSPATLTGEVAPPAGNAPATLGTSVIPDNGLSDEAPASNEPAPSSDAGTPSSEAEPPASTPAAAQPQQ